MFRSEKQKEMGACEITLNGFIWRRPYSQEIRFESIRREECGNLEHHRSGEEKRVSRNKDKSKGAIRETIRLLLTGRTNFEFKELL